MSVWFVVMATYAVVLLGGGLIVTKRRLDQLAAEQAAAARARERLEKVVHDELIPLVQDHIHDLVMLDTKLDLHMRKHVVADDTGRLTKSDVSPQNPKELAAVRDDLVSLARELERPSARSGGVTATARTGARLLVRAASPRTRFRAQRRREPS